MVNIKNSDYNKKYIIRKKYYNEICKILYGKLLYKICLL